jgi:predicted dienelactone hydrolase
MARKKDLGGLAALAGMAYMASRDKAAKGDMPTGDDQYNPDVKQRSATAPDMGEIRDEEGTVSKLRRNTETGEMYDPTGSSSSAAPSRPAAISSKSKTATESKSKAPVLGLNDPGYGDAPEAKTAPVDVTKLSLSERAKLSRERARSDGTKTDSRSVNERMRDSLGMKKGGSVKGWGISRGARKAKIY